MAHLNDKHVDLVIGPSKHRPEDDEAMRRFFAADRKRPGAGRLAAKVLKRVAARKKNRKVALAK